MRGWEEEGAGLDGGREVGEGLMEAREGEGILKPAGCGEVTQVCAGDDGWIRTCWVCISSGAGSHTFSQAKSVYLSGPQVLPLN